MFGEGSTAIVTTCLCVDFYLLSVTHDKCIKSPAGCVSERHRAAVDSPPPPPRRVDSLKTPHLPSNTSWALPGGLLWQQVVAISDEEGTALSIPTAQRHQCVCGLDAERRGRRNAARSLPQIHTKLNTHRLFVVVATKCVDSLWLNTPVEHPGAEDSRRLSGWITALPPDSHTTG